MLENLRATYFHCVTLHDRLRLNVQFSEIACDFPVRLIYRLQSGRNASVTGP